MFSGLIGRSDPQADHARDRAKLEAYNPQLASKNCQTLDIEAELARPPEGPKRYSARDRRRRARSARERFPSHSPERHQLFDHVCCSAVGLRRSQGRVPAGGSAARGRLVVEGHLGDAALGQRAAGGACVTSKASKPTRRMKGIWSDSTLPTARNSPV